MLKAERVEARHGGYTPGPAVKALGLTIVFFALLAFMDASSTLPLLYWYLALSILTFIAYAMDKSAARHGDWRIAENTLHLFSLLGGWPGALCAQQFLRHKSSKQSFRFIYWLTVVLNIAVLGYLTSGHGSDSLATLKSSITQARALNIHILS